MLTPIYFGIWGIIYYHKFGENMNIFKNLGTKYKPLKKSSAIQLWASISLFYYIIILDIHIIGVSVYFSLKWYPICTDSEIMECVRHPSMRPSQKWNVAKLTIIVNGKFLICNTGWIECIDLEVVMHEYQWCIFVYFGELNMFWIMVFNN